MEETHLITATEALEGLYLDFEGQLPTDRGPQIPVLAGVLCENDWGQSILNEEFFGIVSYNSQSLTHFVAAEAREFSSWADSLLAQTARRHRKIVAFGTHEKAMLIHWRPERSEEIESACVDARLTLQTAAKELGVALPKSGHRSLDFYREVFGIDPLPKHLRGEHGWLGDINKEIGAARNGGRFGPGRGGRGSRGQRAWTNQRNRNARDCFDLQAITVIAATTCASRTN